MTSERPSQKRSWDIKHGDDLQPFDESDARPRWFMNHGEEPSPRDWKSTHQPREEPRNLESYMRYSRMRPDSETGEPPASRPSFPARRSHAHATGERHEVDTGGYRNPARPFPQAPHGKRRSARKSLVKELSLAGVISIVFGGAAGLAVYDSTSGGGITQSLVNMTGWSTGGAPETMRAAATEAGSSIVKKPVAIARLDVSDAEGEANSLIPLSLRAESSEPNQLLSLRLSGLPERAYLTAGTRINANAWMLRPGEAQNVKLVVPGDSADQFAIAVEALEPQTGDLVAPVRELNVAVRASPAQPTPASQPPETAEVQPAAAPPETKRNFNLPKTSTKNAGATAMPIPQPIEQTAAKSGSEVLSLIDSGNKLMELGDLPAARQFFAKALELGEPKAAWKLGQTYDPAVFAEKKVVGLAPEPELALKYYLQAQAAGVTEAEAAVSGIKALAEQ